MATHCSAEPWSICTKSCAGGKQHRSRSIAREAINNGKACTHLKEDRACNTHKCPVNCPMSAWTKYSACSVTCGGGKRRRTRKALGKAQYGGLSCGKTEESESCSHKPCKTDCVVSNWSSFSQCSHSCGVGYRQRSRKILTISAAGGAACGAELFPFGAAENLENQHGIPNAETHAPGQCRDVIQVSLFTDSHQDAQALTLHL